MRNILADMEDLSNRYMSLPRKYRIAVCLGYLALVSVDLTVRIVSVGGIR